MSAADEARDGREALELMDVVLAKRPQKDDHALTEMMKRLCVWRDALIARHRDGALEEHERSRLDRLNAVIASVFGVQFPHAGVPWHNLEDARGWLGDLVSEAAAA